MAEWKQRVCNLLEKYAANADGGAFRNNFRDAVDSGILEAGLKQQVVTALTAAREAVEFFVDAPDATEKAIPRWTEFFISSDGILDKQVMIAVLRKVPKQEVPAPEAWEKFLFACKTPELIELVLDRRLISIDDLCEVSESKPAISYPSACFDILWMRKRLRGEKFLSVAKKHASRPVQLLNNDKALIACCTSMALDKATKQFMALVDDERIRGRLLKNVLEFPALAFGVCEQLTFGSAQKAKGKAKGKTSSEVLLGDWLNVCQMEILSETASQLMASLVVARIREWSLASVYFVTPQESEWLKRQADGTVSELLARLIQNKTGTSVIDSHVPVLAFISELQDVFQRYLGSLPSGTSKGSQEAVRQLDRHSGAKDVIEHILVALEEAKAGASLEDAIEVALFNCGVRNIGEVDDVVEFNPGLHSSNSVIVPGEPVRITKPGRILGGESDGWTLEKAVVTPSN